MTMTENSLNFKRAAVLAGPRLSFLDHLAPLCDLFKMPLVCTDTWVELAAKMYYPQSFPILCLSQANFQIALSDCETFFTPEPCRLHVEALQFGEFLFKGKAQTVASFHGNSDKYRASYWIERYLHEDLLLLYGQHNVDFFKEKGIWQRVKKKVFIGNLRLNYYQRNKTFFTETAKKRWGHPSWERTILYAPSWNFSHGETQGTFFESYPYILNDIPKGTGVIVKLHPYTFHLFPDEVQKIKEHYSGSDQILFLDEIPLVFPLLFQADIYLGDYSSVGYDFLAMDKPLFFMTKKPDLLQRSGIVINDLKNIYKLMEKADTFKEERKALYNYSFENVSWDHAKRSIEEGIK